MVVVVPHMPGTVVVVDGTVVVLPPPPNRVVDGIGIVVLVVDETGIVVLVVDVEWVGHVGQVQGQ